ncbi:MAG: glycosyltransferase family 1 protein [Bacteroidota bacterium]|nr:glycosyltransferase family 1 protein [Bacteroidota bacterium]
MNDLHIHIISFDIPYPPVYGGVIDVFYQIKALSEAGVRIHLHAFDYGKGHRSEDLEQYCYRVDYYSRSTGLKSALGLMPYITSSRRSDRLVDELVRDDYPILFEGLHTCYHINDKRLFGRLKLIRTTNIEHRYYANLALAERNVFRKIYFTNAAFKLRFYQQVIKHANLILPVSEADTAYFQKKFPSKKIIAIPCFHANRQTSCERVSEKYVLYQGDLEVAENERAAIYLIRKVMESVNYPFIIAGHSPSARLQHIAARFPNINIMASPDEATMNDLIAKAHINLLVTFQATGLKLKLLNALYKGNFVIANHKMLHGTGLEALCYVADTAAEMKKLVITLMDMEYPSVKEGPTYKALYDHYDTAQNAERLIGLINDELKERNKLQ